MNALIFLLLALMSVGCVEVRSRSHEDAAKTELEAQPEDQAQPESSPQGPPTIQSQPDEAGLRAKVSWKLVPGKPDLYHVELRYPSDIVLINRVVRGGVPEAMTVSQVPADHFVDENLPSGAKLEYQFVFAGGRISLPIDIPKDLVVRGTQRGPFAPRQDYGRVFFMEGSRWITEGGNVELVADSIEVRGAVIETFAENARAADGVHSNGSPGRSGGKIYLKARKVSGNLEVILRGENGGNGGQGLPLSKAPDSVESTTENLSRCEIPQPHPHPGPGGRAGQQGFDGGAGGDSGSIIFDVEDSKELRLSHLFLKGRGGLRGPGGIGQEGGAGGWRFYTPPLRSSCFSNLVRGPKGSTGPVGPEGKDGQDGAIGTCIDRVAKSPCFF